MADFYCAEKKLVVELDGRIHDSQLGYDHDRDEVMTELGLRVLRIRNEKLNNLDVVLSKILAACSNSPPPFPSLQSREGVVERSEIGGELTNE